MAATFHLPLQPPLDRMENAAGSKTGNGRRKPHLIPSRLGLGTSGEDRGRTGHGPRRADRPSNRARRPAPPPGAGPATTAGPSGRRVACGPGTAAEPTAASGRRPSQPRPPTRGPSPTADTARPGRGPNRPSPIANRADATIQFAVCNLQYNSPYRRIYHNPPTSESETGRTHVASYNTSEFRKGLKVQLDGDPYIMIECNFVKPGKGQALYKCKLRNLLRGTVLDRTYKSGDCARGRRNRRNPGPIPLPSGRSVRLHGKRDL